MLEEETEEGRKDVRSVFVAGGVKKMREKEIEEWVRYDGSGFAPTSI